MMAGSPHTTDYVVLEDLTRKYQCPCILDLKMGTRQHGDDQSDEKKRKHTERCALSTSAHLGVRISGMQVWVYGSIGVWAYIHVLHASRVGICICTCVQETLALISCLLHL